MGATIVIPESIRGEQLTHECSPHAPPHNDCTMLPGLKRTPSLTPHGDMRCYRITSWSWSCRSWLWQKIYPVLARTRRNVIKLPKTKRKVKRSKVKSFSSNQRKLDRNEDWELSTGEIVLEVMKVAAVLELLWSVIYTVLLLSTLTEDYFFQ